MAPTAGREARTTPATSATNSDAEGGFALFELILALAIFALVAGVVFPRVARAPGPAELATTAQRIAALLRSDRNAALRQGIEVVSGIDVADATVTSGLSGTRLTIPTGIAVEFLQSSREMRGDTGGIRFRPDGTSSGGVLRLKRGSAVYDVSVNWLTGGVLIAAAGPR